MKRMLLFLLLVGAGAFALWLVIGDEDLVRAGAPTGTSQEQPRGGGVRLPHDRMVLEGQFRGPLHLNEFKDVRDGESVVHVPVYELRARDSEPVGGGVQQLDGLDVRLFDRGAPAAELQARMAFVELGADATGKPSLRADKELDLRDAVLQTLPGARAAGLRLELTTVRVRITDDMVVLRTPGERDPVTLRFEGQQRGTLHGQGLEAQLPRDRASSSSRVDVTIRHDPVVAIEGLRASGGGPLQYVEELAAGTARVTLEQQVAVEFEGQPGRFAALPGGGKPGAGKMAGILRGDRLTGWLTGAGDGGGRRGGGDADRDKGSTRSWRLLQLDGAPASARAAGFEALGSRFTVLSGLSGQPFLISAAGHDSRVRQLDARAGEVPFDVVTPERLHVVRPGEHLGAIHRSFGFPAFALRPLQDLQIAIVEGDCRAEGGAARQLRASRGVRLYRPDPDGKSLLAVGLGEVQVELEPRERGGREPLRARGNDGARMWRSPFEEVLVLGPDADETGSALSATHNYEFEQGALRLRGTGACRVRRAGDDRVQATLRAPAPTITADLGSDRGQMTGLYALFVELHGDTVQAATAFGVPATATFVRNGNTVVAEAPCLDQTGPDSLRLRHRTVDEPLLAGAPAPATMPVLRADLPSTRGDRAQQIAIAAPVIDVHRTGTRSLSIDATGDSQHLPHVTAALPRAGGGPAARLALDARHVRMLPFAVAPLAVRAHSGLPHGLDLVVHRSLLQSWLLADHVTHVELQDEEQGTITGHGDRLILSQAGAGLVIGDANSLTHAEFTQRQVDGRTVTARGAAVRLQRDAGERIHVLTTFPGTDTTVQPWVQLRDPRRTGRNDSLANLAATCDGEIEVLPAEVRFGGPVFVQGLTADGAPDPDGLRVRATRLRLLRNAETRAVQQVLADGGVALDWSRISARSEVLELDLRWQRCVARDPNGARVWLPDGRSFTSPFVRANYQTMGVECYRGRFQQADGGGATERR